MTGVQTCALPIWYLGSGPDYFAYARIAGEDRLMMVFNNADRPTHVHLDLSKTPLAGTGAFRPVVAATAGETSVRHFDADVPPRIVVIYQVQ